jgi:hypothetical protein
MGFLLWAPETPRNLGGFPCLIPRSVGVQGYVSQGTLTCRFAFEGKRDFLFLKIVHIYSSFCDE